MALARPRTPELEHECVRSPTLGYEPQGSYGCVRYLEHGYPNPLVRWHYHEEYELHLIVATRGKVFVGDYIGQFEPGHLVLTGPRLPHNWISTDTPPEGVPLRDMVLQFPDTPLREAAEGIAELREALPLLERARHGIEFFGISERARMHYERIQHTQGLRRFAEFVELLGELAACVDYRLLSTVQLQSYDDDVALARISGIVDYITEHSAAQFSMAELGRRAGMTESQFSRYFRKATGNTFTDFVNRLRINRACQLLMESDRYITNICYDVGFNNVANFNRRFLQIKGMTPKEFRRQAEARFGASRG
ncbi:AraC family transcriptional regulator [Caldimonas brevitalea]|uniref:AraC family transcriptional regulator n=1 Tax=Caldimonas brevitalea TaxID=413882 RepID=A0A0G3BC27_9BURK|nr:AraC family transcriptional regulator [Caldimonas brevitalea]AKJ26862.1 AraC family transcriptional regulator [Caldimonas brevitalea]